DIRPSQTTFTYKLWPRHHRDINQLVGTTTDDVPSPDVQTDFRAVDPHEWLPQLRST
uniref:Uncharacterized protein n=1 Tax=Cucumis melo TaxID=3656 RepID=A0A9I9EF91_CUCME